MKLVYKGVVLSKKNSKQIRKNPRTGQLFIASNNKASNNERQMVQAFKDQLFDFKQSITPDGRTVLAKADRRIGLETPLKVWMAFYEPDHKRRDLDNQITSVLDALVKAGAIPDDSIEAVRGIGGWVAGYDKENPRVEVEILNFKK